MRNTKLVEVKGKVQPVEVRENNQIKSSFGKNILCGDCAKKYGLTKKDEKKFIELDAVFYYDEKEKVVKCGNCGRTMEVTKTPEEFEEEKREEEIEMMIKMFFKDKFTYEIIDDSVTKDDLEKFLKENFISLEIVDDSTEWATFANYYGVQHGFIDIHAASFAYMVSMFMTGMGVSANTEVFLKEDEIEKEICKYFLFKKEDEPLTEKELAIHIFHFIFSLYETRIFEFEYATERLSLKLTPTQMLWFKQVPGETNKEKFLRLLHRRI